MKQLLKSANFRPRVQTRKGSLAGLGVIGNMLVLAILPFCLIAFAIVAPVYFAVSLATLGTRHKAGARYGRGALASG